MYTRLFNFAPTNIECRQIVSLAPPVLSPQPPYFTSGGAIKFSIRQLIFCVIALTLYQAEEVILLVTRFVTNTMVV